MLCSNDYARFTDTYTHKPTYTIVVRSAYTYKHKRTHAEHQLLTMRAYKCKRAYTEQCSADTCKYKHAYIEQ